VNTRRCDKLSATHSTVSTLSRTLSEFSNISIF
jgi:hypothetical protein